MKRRLILAALIAFVLLAGKLNDAQATHNDFCYLVADAGGGPPGNDLLTMVDTDDTNPATNETSVGTGTGTTFIESIAFQPAPGPNTIGPLYAANAGQLGTLSLTTGLFTPTSLPFGAGDGSLPGGPITFSDVDGLAFDTFSGTLYGTHRRTGAGLDDLLFQIDPSTGAHIPDAFGMGIDYVVITSTLAVMRSDIDDISIDPSDGQMYASANNGGIMDRLVIIDSSTGAVTDVGAFGVGDMEGLSFDDNGQLLGTTGVDGFADSNRLYDINIGTGVASNPRVLDNGTDYESVACHKSYLISDPKTSSLFADNDGNGVPSPGDVLEYTITLTNTGGAAATGVDFTDTPDSNTPLVAGSVTTTQGTVTTGNTAGDSSVAVDVGVIAAGSTVTIRFRVTINNPLPPGVDQVANQGLVSGTNFTSRPTDDPGTPAIDDPTVTLLGTTATASELPETGFAPNRTTIIPAPSSELAYQTFADLSLEIPGLAVQIPIVGVPFEADGWDVSQLWEQAGYLEGTAFPTWAGNTALTGHVYLSDGTPGPFYRLKELGWGDELIVHAFGQSHEYEVREVTYVRPDDLSVLGHEEYDWVTLITCYGYDDQMDTYRWRSVVRAVLVEISQP